METKPPKRTYQKQARHSLKRGSIPQKSTGVNPIEIHQSNKPCSCFFRRRILSIRHFISYRNLFSHNNYHSRCPNRVHSMLYLVNLSLIHISEPTRLGMISYAVFCLKKKKK